MIRKLSWVPILNMKVNATQKLALRLDLSHHNSCLSLFGENCR